MIHLSKKKIIERLLKMTHQFEVFLCRHFPDYQESQRKFVKIFHAGIIGLFCSRLSRDVFSHTCGILLFATSFSC